jgi:Zn-dependent M28 family amino/carboxypeptidase
MLRAQAFLTALLAAFAAAGDVSGDAALEFARRAVAFGPRPSGSEANRQLQNYILEQLRQCKCQVAEDAFTARTPRGPIAMKNIIAKFAGKPRAAGAPPNAIAVTGHFDTKYFPGRKFVGANDGGSSTGLLLELARALAGEPRSDDVSIVFFDGEEATGDWTETDKLYGSRHLAQRWRADGTLARLKGLINVDMIGDRNLNLRQDTNSDPRLRQLVWRAAAELGYQAFFTQATIAIDDDHMPFAEPGVPVVDLIDFDYESWHEDTDTMDKISAQSLQIVGRVVVESVRRLERQ